METGIPRLFQVLARRFRSSLSFALDGNPLHRPLTLFKRLLKINSARSERTNEPII